ncbi:MAG: Tim44/TimA family putative adaptor protein [Ancalomicrobiaceae bacterium]|nr:Tim44/TimA family putative adaptor protein [Ancalomicrobiaceae bacterium]
MGVFDIYTVILLVVAVAIIWKLRSVLGTKTGAERPPVDRYAPPRPEPPDFRPNGETVVPLNRPNGSSPPEGPIIEAESQPPRSGALDAALRAVTQADRSFDQTRFLGGAKMAYEMIVTAFANADRKGLKPLLSKEVFDGFASAIDARERSGQKVETKFVGIDRAEIVEASVKGGMAEITVRFVSQLITVTRDAAGEVVDGDPTRVADIIDIWTFARDISSSDPNWRLVSTQSG